MPEGYGRACVFTVGAPDTCNQAAQGDLDLRVNWEVSPHMI